MDTATLVQVVYVGGAVITYLPFLRYFAKKARDDHGLFGLWEALLPILYSVTWPVSVLLVVTVELGRWMSKHERRTRWK